MLTMAALAIQLVAHGGGYNSGPPPSASCAGDWRRIQRMDRRARRNPRLRWQLRMLLAMYEQQCVAPRRHSH